MLLRLLGAWLPAIPAPLVAVALATALSAAFDFPGLGISVVGDIPSSLPSPMLPIPHGVSISELVLGAAAVLIVSFGAGIVTARSFGAKNKYPVDANRELLGFGAANVASGLFGGFAVTASDSRTAINDLMGGKTQLAGIVSAVALAFTVLFPHRCALVPAHAGARRRPCFGRHQSHRFADTARIVADQPDRDSCLRLISVAGVLGLGVLNGVIVAVGATLLYLLMKGLRPRDAMLGRIPGREGFYKLHRHREAQPIPGLVIYLLQGSLLFFNADYVRSRMEEICRGLAPETRWFIFDASAAAQIDSTAAVMLDDVRALAEERGVKFGIVELHSEPLEILERSGVVARVGPDMIFDDLEDVVGALSADLGRPAS